jgi:CRISPR-associated Cas5-like protein
MWLEGPLQSWGDHSKYGRRDTLTFPTKSAIYGMILAAMDIMNMTVGKGYVFQRNKMEVRQ